MIRTVRKPRPRASSAHWQIIYMDLMTIMMVYFVILWSAEQGSKDSEFTGISPTIGDQTVRMINLPGDVLFSSGRSDLSGQGRDVFIKLFGDDPSAVLSFDQGGLARRQLVIHGHTDAVGDKDENFALGYERAFAVYKEIRRYGQEVPDNVVICTHADNSPAVAVPAVSGKLTDEERQELRVLRAKNRRITIEDQIINTSKGVGETPEEAGGEAGGEAGSEADGKAGSEADGKAGSEAGNQADGDPGSAAENPEAGREPEETASDPGAESAQPEAP